MAAGVSNLITPLTTVPEFNSQPAIKTEVLRKSLAAFVNKIVVEGGLLDDTQLQEARTLVQQVLKLYTPEKLVELHGVANRVDSFAGESFYRSLFDPAGEKRPQQINCGAQIALECWKNRKALTVEKFLINFINVGQVFWRQAPDLSDRDPEIIEASLVLNRLLDEESNPELLKVVRLNLAQHLNVDEHIRDEEITIHNMKLSIEALPENILGLARLKNEKLKEELEKNPVDKTTLSAIMDARRTLYSIDTRENDLIFDKEYFNYQDEEDTESTPYEKLICDLRSELLSGDETPCVIL